MGAQNIDFERLGKLTKQEILGEFMCRQRRDKGNNGSQEGYSGDFQTVDTIEFDVLNDGTGDYEHDYDLALENAEKWSHGQAIYTKNSKGEDITLVVAWGAC